MKKISLIITALFMMSFMTQAQHVFDKGDIGLNLGFGMSSYGGFVPSVEFSGEVGVIPTGDIGLVSFGGMVGYKYSRYLLNDDMLNKHNSSGFQIGARAAWHLHTFTSDKWDVYAGVGLGSYTKWDSYYYDYNNHTESYTDYYFYQEIFIGGRVKIKDNFGFFAEIGYNRLSSARVGFTFFM